MLVRFRKFVKKCWPGSMPWQLALSLWIGIQLDWIAAAAAAVAARINLEPAFFFKFGNQLRLPGDQPARVRQQLQQQQSMIGIQDRFKDSCRVCSNRIYYVICSWET